MAFHGLIWPFIILYVLLWSYVAFFGHIKNGHIIVFNGLSWQNIDLIGLVSSFLAVIHSNSFGPVHYVSSFRSLRCFIPSKDISELDPRIANRT